MTLFHFITALLVISCASASPVHIKTNIRNQIIDISDSAQFISSSHPVVHQADSETFDATSATAAGIVRSRLGFVKIARGGGGVSLPAVPGINFKGKVSGSITFKGYMASSVNTAVSNLTKKYDSSFRSTYKNEEKKLRSRAKAKFFWFFQAGANYGYTKNKVTRDFVNSGDFKDLSDRSERMLTNNEQTDLVANFEGEFSGTTTGVPGVAQWFGYIVVNQITLDSGAIFNVVKENPELTVADDRGDVLGTQNSGATVKPKNINDSIIDTSLAGN